MKKKISEMTYDEFVDETLQTYARAEAVGMFAGWLCKKIGKYLDKAAEKQKKEDKKDDDVPHT